MTFPKLERKPTAVIRATTAAMSCPIPCMEKTAAIMPPRHLVGANLVADESIGRNLGKGQPFWAQPPRSGGRGWELTRK